MKNGEQLTPVEWLKEQYDSWRFLGESDWKKAKEMEENRVREAVISTFKNIKGHELEMTAEEYYQLNYKPE